MNLNTKLIPPPVPKYLKVSVGNGSASASCSLADFSEEQLRDIATDWTIGLLDERKKQLAQREAKKAEQLQAAQARGAGGGR